METKTAVRIYKVYTLADPITKEIMYVGITKRGTRHRLNCHMFLEAKDWKYNPNRCEWILSLKQMGLRPILEVLEEFDNEPEAMRSETYWTDQFKSWGFNIFNILSGRSMPFSTRQKLSKTHVGKKLSDEWRAAMRRSSRKGQKLTGQHLLKTQIAKAKCRIPVISIKEGIAIEHVSVTAAAIYAGVSRQAVRLCLQGKSKTSGGYIWGYKKTI